MSLPWNSFNLCAPTLSEKRTESFTSWVKTSSMKRFTPKLIERPGATSPRLLLAVVYTGKRCQEGFAGVELPESPSDGTGDIFFFKRRAELLIASAAGQNFLWLNHLTELWQDWSHIDVPRTRRKGTKVSVGISIDCCRAVVSYFCTHSCLKLTGNKKESYILYIWTAYREHIFGPNSIRT